MKSPGLLACLVAVWQGLHACGSIVVPDGTNDMTHVVLDEVRRTLNRGASTVELAEGDYHFYSSSATPFHFNVSNHDQPSVRPVFLPFVGVTNLVLRSSSARFVMHGMGTAVLLQNTSDIVLEGITVEWEHPFFAQAEIVGFNRGVTYVRFSPRDRVVLDGRRLYLCGEDWRSPLSNGMLFNRGTHEVIPGTGDVVLGESAAGYERGVYTLSLDCSKIGAGARVGDILVLRDWCRPHPIVCLDRARNTTLRDFVFRDGFGMGILAQMCENVTLQRGGCFPRSAAEYSSNTIDATHFSNCRGQVIVEDCRFEGMLDDALNVHSTSLRICERVSDTVIVCRYMHHQTYDLNLFARGDSVRFIAGRTLENGPVARVTAVERLDAYNIRLTFGAPIPAAYGTGDAIENANAQCGVIFRNNRVSNNRARGILLTTPKPVICESNRFEHVSGAAILLAGDAMDWYESGACEDVKICGNTFVDCMTSQFQYCDAIISIHPEVRALDEQKMRYHRNIVIEDNVIETFDVPLLFALSTKDLIWRNNGVTYHRRYPSAHKEPFIFQGCERCSVGD